MRFGAVIKSWVRCGVMMAIVSVGGVCFASGGNFEYWEVAEVGFDINKDWRGVFEERIKVRDTGGELYYHHSDLGFVYKSFADWIDVGVNFRKIYTKDSGGEWRQEDRPHLNVTLKTKIFGCQMSDLSRVEYRDREKAEDFWRYRNKLTVKLPVELTALKLQPYFAEEVFISMNGEGFNRNRLFGGFTVKISKNVKGDIFYIWQADRTEGCWEDINIIGTGLKFYF